MSSYPKPLPPETRDKNFYPHNNMYGFVHDINIDKIDFTSLLTGRSTTRMFGKYHLIKWDSSKLSDEENFYYVTKPYLRLFGDKFEFNYQEILHLINDTHIETQLEREWKLELLLND